MPEKRNWRKLRHQRIRLRKLGHVAKLDGEIVEYNRDTGGFIVEFDGPLPDIRFVLAGSGEGNHVVEADSPEWGAYDREVLRVLPGQRDHKRVEELERMVRGLVTWEVL